MKRRIEYALADGGEIITVEVDEPEEGGLGPVSRGNTVERAQDSFQGALGKLHPIISGVFNAVRQSPALPDEFTVELGVKFDAVAGVIISEVGVEANLKLTICWKNDSLSTAATPTPTGP